MCQSLFFNKVAGLRQLYLKRDSDTGVFLLILRNFEEHLFHRTNPVAAAYSLQTFSVYSKLWLSMFFPQRFLIFDLKKERI